MKKNKLYTVNKGNIGFFQGNRTSQNIFDGADTSFIQQPNFASAGSLSVGNGIDYKEAVSDAASASGGLGASFMKSAGDSLKFNGLSGLGSSLGSAVSGGISGIGSAVGGAIGGLIGNGYTSGVGNVMNSVGKIASVIPGPWGAAISGGLQILGGGVNALFGTKVDQKKLQATNKGTAEYNNFKSTATNFDDVKTATAQQGVLDAYSGGAFRKGWAEERNKELHQRRIAARQFASNSVRNNVNNLVSDQINDSLANFSAYGGPLDLGGGALGLMQQNRYFDTIDKRSEAIASKGQVLQTGFTGGAKTFADGGSLESSFLDDFSTDPIAAAVRYSKGIERREEERQAAEEEAAREAAYLDTQKQLAGLQAQNMGLQSIIDAMPSYNTPEIQETPESSLPSVAAPSVSSGNTTWDYIEDQLRRSGKFNENQIKGIKYNLQRESSINPDVVGDGGSAFGLGQWHGSRKPKDMSLEGQTRHLIDTISNFDGKEHWISRKDYEGFLNARTPEEAHYYLAKGYERPRADIVAKVKRDSDMSLKNIHAFGGELGTNGTDFTNGLLYIDEGDTHERNPLDGVPLGLDPQGIPNLVEEGETVYNNYVFSDRMLVPGFMYKELGLGGVVKKKGNKGMSFADASKKLAKESEQRPNDPISQAGLDAALAKLAEVQETERSRKQMEESVGLEYALGGSLGNRYDLGGAKNYLRQTYPNMDEKTVNAVASALSKYIDANKDSFYKTSGLSGGVNYDIDYDLAFTRLNNSGEEGFNNWVNNGLDRRAAFQLTHPMPKKPKNQDLMTEYNNQLKSREAAWGRLVGNAGKQQTKENLKQQDAAKKQAQASARKADVAAQNPQTVGAGTNKGYSRTSAQQVVSPQQTVAASTAVEKPKGSSGGGSKRTKGSTGTDSNRNYDGVHATDYNPVPYTGSNPYPTSAPYPRDTPTTPRGAETQGAGYLAADMGVTNDEARKQMNQGVQQAGQKATAQVQDQRTKRSTYEPYDTWMRYAPVVGSGLAAFTDALGLTNRADYSNVAGLEAAANAAGYVPNVSYDPIGNYLAYNPMDIWYQQNALNAQARATDRALANSTSPSRAAGLLANGYNTQLASGNLYRQALEYNDAQRKEVEDFNRKTNMFNSQMGLEAAMANARYRQQGLSAQMSGLAQAAAMKDAIDARASAARSANLTNFFDSLGDIGRENFAFNMVNSTKAAHNGYGYDRRNGAVGHAAYGGKIKKRKK